MPRSIPVMRLFILIVICGTSPWGQTWGQEPQPIIDDGEQEVDEPRVPNDVDPKRARQLVTEFERGGIAQVIKVVEKEDVSSWYGAFETLGVVASKDLRIRTMLVQLALDADDDTVRFHSNYALLQIEGEHEEVKTALIAMSDQVNGVDTERLLAYLGKQAEQELRNRLAHGRADVRRNSLRLLSQLDQDQEEFLPTYRAGLLDEDISVRRRAALTLVELHHPSLQVIETLIACFDIPIDLGPDGLESYRYDSRLHEALKSLGRDAAPALIEAIIGPQSSDRVRRSACRTLRVIGEKHETIHLSPAAERLHAAIDSPDPTTRAWAALALVGIDSRAFDAANHLIPWLESSPSLQIEVFDALSNLDSEPDRYPDSLILPLLKAYFTADEDLREYPLRFTFRRMSYGPRAIDFLVRQMEQEEFRATIIKDILWDESGPRDPRFVPYLKPYISNLTGRNMGFALRNLGSMGDEGAQALAEFTLDTQLDESFRRSSLEALASALPAVRRTDWLDPLIPAFQRMLRADAPDFSVETSVVLAYSNYEGPLADLLVKAAATSNYHTWWHLKMWVIRRESEADEIAAQLVEGLTQDPDYLQKSRINLLSEIAPYSVAARAILRERLLKGESIGRWDIAEWGEGKTIVPLLVAKIAQDDPQQKLIGISGLNSMIRSYQDPTCCPRRVPRDGRKELELREIPVGLVDALAEDDFTLKLAAVELLRRFEPNHPAALAALMEIVEQGDNKRENRNAAEMLSEFAHQLEPEVDRLIDLLNNPERRDLALVALSGAGESGQPAVPKLIQVLEDSPGDHQVIAALKSIGPAAINAEGVMVEQLQTERWSEDIARAYAAIGGSLQRIAPWIDTTLADKENRGSGLKVLVDLSPALDVSPWLLGALRSDDLELRYLVAEALGKYQAPVVPGMYEPLIELTRHSNPHLRRVAAEALKNQLGPADKVVPALIHLLEDEDSKVRSHAALAIGEYGEQAASAVPKLIPLLNQEGVDFGVDFRAVGALKAIGPQALMALPALESRLLAESPPHRYAHLQWSTHAEILRTIEQFGPSAKAVLPTLVKLQMGPIPNEIKLDLAAAIWSVDPETADRVGAPRPQSLK